jgi:hypothetical protein
MDRKQATARLSGHKPFGRRREGADELDEQKARLNPNEVTAPPNSPRQKPHIKTLFNSPRVSTPRSTAAHKQSYVALDSSSEERSKTERFFHDTFNFDEELPAPITFGRTDSKSDHSSSLRDSLVALNALSLQDSQHSGVDSDPSVVLDPAPADAGDGPLKGLKLKQAAAHLDLQHPLDTVRALNAWLASAPCDKKALRLKTPQQGLPFMSRSRFSAKDSFMFDHDADHDVPEQIAAFEHLHALANCRLPEMTRGHKRALAALGHYLGGLKPGTSFHAIQDRQRFKRIKDTPALRRLLQATETALAEAPRNNKTISSLGPDKHPQVQAGREKDQGAIDS